MKKILLTLLALSTLLLHIGCDAPVEVRGERQRELPRELKKPNTSSESRKIIAFGDSLTAGFGLTERESYPFLLQQKLRRDGYEFEVINAGVSGDTTLGGLERVEWVLGQENVEIMILGLGGNDLLRGVPVERMRKNLEGIIKKAKAKGISVLLCGMLAPDTMGEKYQREFVNTFADLATKYDLEFMPFMLEDVALNKDLNQPDGIHPNAKGTELMTANIYKALKPLLKKKKTESDQS